MKGIFAVIFLGVTIGYQFDSKMAVIYIADYLCSAFIVFLMKKGWELRKERARAFTKCFYVLAFSDLCTAAARIICLKKHTGLQQYV